MTSIKEATASAIAFARETLGAERTVTIRLEEIETTTVGDEDAWLVTLSTLDPEQPLGAVLGGKHSREYKTFTVRKKDGEVTSMKMRELADA